jgi:hypothetical protein
VMAAALVVCMPLWQWRQTVVWLSGFSNYALASLVLLGFAVSIHRERVGGRSLSVVGGVALFVFAVAGQLFIEHVTVFIVLASVVNVAVHLWRDRRVTARSVIWLAGSLIGAAIMFSNSAYRSAIGGDRYQGLAADKATGATGLHAILIQGTHKLPQYAVIGNTFLNATLFALVVILTLLARSGGRDVAWFRYVPAGLAGVGVAGAAAVRATIAPGESTGTLIPWAWLPALALFCSLVLTALLLIEERVRAAMVLALTVAVPVLVAPLAAVTPFGPRNFLPSYLLMAAVALLLLAEARQRMPELVLARVVIGVGAGAVIVVLANYWAVYRVIDQQADDRARSLQQAAAAGQDHAAVRRLPFPEYMHVPDPTSALGVRKFNAYYGLPPDFRVELIGR